MKNFRIKNYDTIGYIVQERTWFFFWVTHCESLHRYEVFKTIEEAKKHIKDHKQHIVNYNYKLKNLKHTEYLN